MFYEWSWDPGDCLNLSPSVGIVELLLSSWVCSGWKQFCVFVFAVFLLSVVLALLLFGFLVAVLLFFCCMARGVSCTCMHGLFRGLIMLFAHYPPLVEGLPNE